MAATSIDPEGPEPVSAYALGIAAGHEWWRNGAKSDFEYPPNPETDPERAKDWERGFDDGSGDAAAQDGW